MNRTGTMISVSEARACISSHVLPLPPRMLPMSEACGLTLSEDVCSPLDLPAFRQSSMDGYAFSFDGHRDNVGLDVVGVVAAGDGRLPGLQAGQAARIFTGAPVPEGADTVVMQERCIVTDGRLWLGDAPVSKGDHVRPRGSEIKLGELALPKGTRLTPAAIGLLSGMGIIEVPACPPPSVCIIVTGNELQEPGTPLGPAQVYESNSHTLTAALQQMQIRKIHVVKVQDDAEQTTRILETALRDFDLILVNGGISVGEFDFTAQAAASCGVKQLFHRVRQKPGKPLYFGMKGDKVVFGLPGNPASVLTCFYEYVSLALSCMFPCNVGVERRKVPLASAFNKPAGLTHFLKGYYDGRTASILGAQESYRLRSFALANCLIVMDEEVTGCIAGEEVEIRLLPT